MSVRWITIAVVVAAGLWLRLGTGRDERRSTLVALVASSVALALAVLGVAVRGLDLVDAYLVGAAGALAVSGRDPVARPVLGLALVLLGGGLGAVTLGGVAPPSGVLDLKLAMLALTVAAASGALGALALGRLARASFPVLLLSGAALVTVFCLHRPDDAHPDWWGILAGIRFGDAALYLFSPAELGQVGWPVIVSRGTGALLGLTAVGLVLVALAVPSRRRLASAGAALLVLASSVLLVLGGLTDDVGELTRGSLEAWSAAGLLQPPIDGPVYLDLATVLPVLVAFAVAVGLFECGTRSPLGPSSGPRAEDLASDLDLAIILGALLMAVLVGVWRWVWGSGLGEGATPLLFVTAAATLGLRLVLPFRDAGALGAALLLVLGVGQLPAGALPGLS